MKKTAMQAGPAAAATLVLISSLGSSALASDWNVNVLGKLTAPLPVTGPAPKVIVISLDGAKPQFIDAYIKAGVLPLLKGVGEIRALGAYAHQNVTATPSLTAVSHIAIATGSTAVHNDIPSNTFSAVAGPLTGSTSGFGAAIGGYSINPLAPTATPSAVPLWVALRQAGRKVVTATWPGGDGAEIRINGTVVQNPTPTRTVDYTVPFGAFGGLGAQGFNLTAVDFAPNAAIAAQLAAAGHPSYSPVQVTAAPFETVFCAPNTAATCGTTNANGRTLTYAMRVAALDTTNNKKVDYDTLVFFDDAHGIPSAPFATPSTGPAYVKKGKSAPFFYEGSGSVVGAAFYAVNIAPNLSQVRFARYGANFIPQNAAVLGDVADVNNTIGFWAPQNDFRIPERLSPGFEQFSDLELEAIYEDQADTFIQYQAKVSLHAIDTHRDADLVMIYFEEPDGSEHQFLLTDPRQASNPANANSIGAQQDPAKVARYEEHVQAAYQSANSAVTAILAKVGKKYGLPRSNVFIVSDHGFAPFHTAVGANNLLAAALVSHGFSASLVNTAVAIRTSGPAAHVYVNLTGRESGGTVDATTYQQLVAAIADYFQNVTDPNAKFNYSLKNQKLFGKVFVRPTGCGNPGFCTSDDVGQDSGDIFAMLDLGYNFDGVQSPGVARMGDPAFNSATTILSVPNFYGAHGNDPNLIEMSASFYAVGPNIKRAILPQVRNIDVAPTIMTILGLAPTPTMDGTPLTKIIK